MSMSAAYVKKSITIPADLFHQAEEFFSKGGLSSYISKALQRQVERDNLEQLTAEMEAIHGPVDEDEVERVRQLVNS